MIHNYETVREIISLRIASRRWPPGFKLPSTEALATDFGVSVSLINNVMRSLAEAKLIYGVPGVGRFVAGTDEDAADPSAVDTGTED